MNKKLFLILLGMFFIATALCQPPSFHQFYGQVLNTSGSQVTENYSIQAYINNSLVVMTESLSGEYGYDEVFLVEGGRDGDIITFTVGNFFSRNFTYSEEDFTLLDLVYNDSAEIICVDEDGDSFSPTGGNCGEVDCNDQNAAIYPGRSEDCSTPYDDNCNGLANEGCADIPNTGDSCFPAGTKILMANNDYKRIEEIKIGDVVLSYDEEEDKIVSSKVLELEFPIRNHMCEIIFAEGFSIKLTNEHPVYTSKGWKSINPTETLKENSELVVEKLEKEDKVLFSDSNYRVIEKIECWDEEIQTYNLKSIENYNNFYAENILVHNKGGGSTTPSSASGFFNLDTDSFYTVVKKGESDLVVFTVSNPTIYNFDIYVESELEMVSFDSNHFNLLAGQSRTITVTIAPDLDVESDLYIDHLKVWSSAEEEEILLSVEVQNPDSIFDIILDIPEADLQIWPGETLHASFLMTRIVPIDEAQEVLIKYIVKDEEDNEVLFFEETKEIQNEADFVKEIDLPKTLDNGRYVLFAQMLYEGDKPASASKWFDVGPKKIDNLRLLIILIILAIAIVSIIIVLIIHYRNFKKPKLVNLK